MMAMFDEKFNTLAASIPRDHPQAFMMETMLISLTVAEQEGLVTVDWDKVMAFFTSQT